ncbi:hypothetical protein [Scytonema sp. NUACC26]|uniref:hypothetical protein n=1 Tax=Scytonema sp. NUACC26 TaxID=3140176 RepID=UPI0034DBF898
MGDQPGPKFLDGRTTDGTVGLAPETGRVFTGTKWRFRAIGVNGGITLESLGDRPGSKFLDGRVRDGSVGLAPNTDPPFTGTQWQIVNI